MKNETQENLFSTAVEYWWKSKDEGAGQNKKTQGGNRDANLRGDTMDGFRKTIISRLHDAGVAEEDIFSGSHLSKKSASLPSYFRAAKNWDIVICKNSRYKNTASQPFLVAAIEFKSQLGSIGNNQNNRIEESIGNAADFWESYENKNFIHLQPRPWLGYVFVGHHPKETIDCSVKVSQPHFPADPAFSPPSTRETTYMGPSYAERYRIFLERMIGKKQYDGAAFIVTDEAIKDDQYNYRCLYPHLSGENFLDLLVRHVTAYYDMSPYTPD